MSRDQDTYEQALKEDASAALDVLADKAFAAATALNIEHTGHEAYDFRAHRTAVDHHSGICNAVLEVYRLLEQYRNERRAGAA